MSGRNTLMLDMIWQLLLAALCLIGEPSEPEGKGEIPILAVVGDTVRVVNDDGVVVEEVPLKTVRELIARLPDGVLRVLGRDDDQYGGIRFVAQIAEAAGRKVVFLVRKGAHGGETG